MAFIEALFFPAAVFGPGDLCEFRRLLSIFLKEMEDFPRVSFDPPTSFAPRWSWFREMGGTESGDSGCC